MLASSSGAGMSGGVNGDGNPSTVQDILLEHQGYIDGINTQLATINGRVHYLYIDRNKVLSSSDVARRMLLMGASLVIMQNDN
jgi:hypothetical protein